MTLRIGIQPAVRGHGHGQALRVDQFDQGSSVLVITMAPVDLMVACLLGAEGGHSIETAQGPQHRRNNGSVA